MRWENTLRFANKGACPVAAASLVPLVRSGTLTRWTSISISHTDELLTEAVPIKIVPRLFSATTGPPDVRLSHVLISGRSWRPLGQLQRVGRLFHLRDRRAHEELPSFSYHSSNTSILLRTDHEDRRLESGA